MKLRHHILFHMDKTKTFSIFYDERKKQFYRKYTKTNTSFIYLFTGIGATFVSIGLSSATFHLFQGAPIFAILMSFFLSIVFFAVTIYFAEKNSAKDTPHYFDIVHEDYLYALVIEGERSLRMYIGIVVGIFVVAIGITFALFAIPEDPVLFVSHTIFWWTFLVMLFTGNMVKRKRLYRIILQKIEG